MLKKQESDLPASQNMRQHLIELKLVEQLRQGDERAVEQWFKQYQDKLLRLMLSKLPSTTDAEELVQEVFVHCLQNLGFFRGDSSLWTWMQAIARHEIADFYRKKYAKRAIQTLPLNELLAGVVPAPIGDAHEVAARVKQVLASMRADHSELLLLKYVDRISVKDIATRAQRSIKAVESDLFRARDEFRRLYVLELNIAP